MLAQFNKTDDINKFTLSVSESILPVHVLLND